MKTAILTAFLLMAAPSAQAGSWTTDWTGPHGGNYKGAGNCDNGECKASGTFRGPFGGLWKHAGVAHRIAEGKWEGSGDVTGPGGQVFHHTWTWSASGQ